MMRDIVCSRMVDIWTQNSTTRGPQSHSTTCTMKCRWELGAVNQFHRISSETSGETKYTCMPTAIYCNKIYVLCHKSADSISSSQILPFYVTFTAGCLGRERWMRLWDQQEVERPRKSNALILRYIICEIWFATQLIAYAKKLTEHMHF